MSMDFDQLVWKPHPIGEGWDDVTPDPVVWTAVDLLDRAWRSVEDYVGPAGVGSNQPGKYERVGDFLRQYAGKLRIFVPHITLVHGDVWFTDGRHRFAWLRDRGLQAVPIEVSEESLEEFTARFATSQRVGKLDTTES